MSNKTKSISCFLFIVLLTCGVLTATSHSKSAIRNPQSEIQNNPATDPEAEALLQKVSDKYKAYKNIAAHFMLLIQRPKLNPDEPDSKYVDTMTGNVLLEGTKFKITARDQQIICDGKNIWTYSPADKEVQVNYFEEGDDIFSPSKIFSLYKQGYLYQIKEKITVKGKKMTVIEMAPPDKKVTYFKIDITIDDATMELVESKVYEKNGIHYLYKLLKQTPNAPSNAETFTFQTKKYPGVKVVDLR